jgi:SAM-dependent methyltransferase
MSISHDTLVDRQFGEQAQAYVTSAAHSSGPDLDRIGAIAEAYPDARVIDLGCGGGHAAYRAAPYVVSVVACDLSPAMLAAVEGEAVRRGLGNISVQRASAEDLPFDDGAFDLLLCRMTAHHWRDWEAGLAEARRVLRAGGRGVFIDTIAPVDALIDTHLQAIELLRDPSHVRNRPLAEWSAALGRAGFAIERVGVHRLPLDFTSWIARMRTPEAHVAAIRSLQEGATGAVRDALDTQADGSFSIDIATFEVRVA